jgi:hypothetical protein
MKYANFNNLGLSDEQVDAIKDCISYRQAERETEKEIKVWHCRNYAERGCGCCSPGDISFNEVG